MGQVHEESALIAGHATCEFECALSMAHGGNSGAARDLEVTAPGKEQETIDLVDRIESEVRSMLSLLDSDE